MPKATAQDLLRQLYELDLAYGARGSTMSPSEYGAAYFKLQESFRALHPEVDLKKALQGIHESKLKSAVQEADGYRPPAPAIPAATAEAKLAAAGEKVEAAIDATNSHRPNWLNRVGKGKAALVAVGTATAVGLGVLAWKEYVAKPDAGPQAHAK